MTHASRRGRRFSEVAMAVLVPVLSLAGAGALSGTAQAGATHSSPVTMMSAPVYITPGTHPSTHPAELTPLLHGRQAAPHGGNTELTSSENWDGYAVTPAVGSTTTFDEVQASWLVPTATCDPNQPDEELAVEWVGLDGFGTSSVEQGGTIATCNSGLASYHVWWEMFPFNGITQQFSVNPGDQIKASVTFVPSSGDFDIVVDDVTLGQTLTEDVPCQPTQNGCARASAEVISEDPGGNGVDVDGLFPLTDYGTETFTGASVTDSTGHTGTMSDPSWQTFQLNEVSSQGVTKQTAGPLSTDGSSFTTTWQSTFGSPPGSQLEAFYETGDTAPGTTEPEPFISIENAGPTAVPLSNVTIRYWFTEDGTQPLEYACDYVPLGCSNVTGSFVQVTPVTGADHYLQISFSTGAGQLAPGHLTGVLQSRFFQQDFANMTQTNDYSFNASDTSLTLNPHVTVYYNGKLVYGTEPS
jgi:hypothetical protein